MDSILNMDDEQLEELYNYYIDLKTLFEDDHFWELKLNKISYDIPVIQLENQSLIGKIYFYIKNKNYESAINLITKYGDHTLLKKFLDWHDMYFRTCWSSISC